MEIQCQRHNGTIGSNRSAALENLNDNKDIKRVWESIKGDNKTSARGSLGLYELKHQKS
jgi:hypothetical protein